MKSANLHDALDATKKNPQSSQEIMTLPRQKQIVKFIRDNDFATTKTNSKIHKKIAFDAKTNL
jgi:hypothetical protein